MKKNKNYTPAPQVPPEMLERLALVQEVLAGKTTVSEAARRLGMSRNHFQTILHRGLAGLVEAIGPKSGGRPAKAKEVQDLEAEVARLRRENSELSERVGTTDRLLEVASGLLHGRIRASGRQSRAKKTKASPDEKKPDEPDGARRRAFQAVVEMRRLGLTATLAARVAGAHEATLRRWRARERCGEPLACRAYATGAAPSLQAAQRAAELVRSLNGLVGAESLRRSVPGISRRQAARVKAQTLTCMERERKRSLTRVTVTAPDVVRGLDAMYLRCALGRLFAMFSADAAVPYRTQVKTGARYDAELVAQALASDIKMNGAPLVYRFDRAAAHDAPAVRELLAAHQVLVLHGPPRLPRFYGQHERLNREHRAWDEELALLSPEETEQRLEQMLEAVNKHWRRRTLGWRTAYEAWSARRHLEIDRRALREEVSERAARIGRQLHRGKPADLAQRLAIEQALETRGYLRQQPGGWC
jgi:transposase-like protein